MPSDTQTSAPPVPATKDFLHAAVGSDQFEISEAQTALAQSRNPQVRAFAEAMIKDHEADAQALMEAARTAGLPPPPMSMSGDQAHLLGAIQSLRGAEFDKAYAKQQGLAHTQALVVTQSYAGGGADAAVRQAAQTAVPMIQQHLEMAKQMKAQLGGD
jgi:putative membrane protein